MKNIEKKKAILVLGMHRSGTSLLTAGLKVLGINLGRISSYKNIENEKGFFENSDVQSLNDKCLEHLGVSWANPFFSYSRREILSMLDSFLGEAVLLLETYYTEIELWAVKDPRMCLLLPFWQKAIAQSVMGDTYYLHIVRNPVEVAASLAKRKDRNKLLLCNDVRQNHILWFNYHYRALENIDHDRNLLLTYEELLDDPLKQLNRMALFLDVEMEPNKIKQYTENFVDQSLCHNLSSLDDLSNQLLGLEFVKDFYIKLVSLSERPVFGRRDIKNLLSSLPDLQMFFACSRIAAPAFKNAEYVNTCRESFSSQVETIRNLENSLLNRENTIVLKTDELVLKTDELALKVDALNILSQIKKSKESIIANLYQIVVSLQQKNITLDQAVHNRNNHIVSCENRINEIILVSNENLEKYTGVISCMTWKVSHRVIAFIKKIPLTGRFLTLLKKIITKIVAKRQITFTKSSLNEELVEDSLILNKRKEVVAQEDEKKQLCVSVVIPTYNRASLIPSLLACWREVHRNTFYSYELIFSDDGSDDNTVELLRLEKELPLVIIENPHGGVSKARNSAITIAKGEKIIIVGDDIYPNPLFINQHYQQLLKLDKSKAVLGLTLWHDKTLKSHLMEHITDIGFEQFSYPNLPIFDFTDCRHFYTSNISMDREFLLTEEVIFDERFYLVNFEDVELAFRLEKRGMQVFYNPSIRAYHDHEYHQVENFCRRQRNAGEMAVVFSTIHPDAEWVTLVRRCEDKYRAFVMFLARYEIREHFEIIAHLVQLCQILEESLLQSNNKELCERLSVIYQSLFRFFYEDGVLSKQYNEYDEFREFYFLQEFLQDQFLQEAIVKAARYYDELPSEHKDALKTAMPDELMVSGLASWFKGKFSNPCLVPLLSGKKHQVLEILVNDEDELIYFRRKYEKIEGYLVFSIKDTSENVSVSLAIDFCYAPSNVKNSLSVNELQQVILFMHLYGNAVDFVLVSTSLKQMPIVSINSVAANTIFLSTYRSAANLFAGNSLLNGKVVRLLSGVNRMNDDVNLQSCFGSPCSCSDDGFVTVGSISPTPSLPQIGNEGTVIPRNKTKKLVFIFPIILAVGGVERNTIEIMTSLSDKYDFVVITMERLLPQQGSLHHQFLAHSLAVYDLAELSVHESYISFLKILKEEYSPDLIWICNGSPWLENNTLNIRRLFFDTPIVDQQAYDTDAGWISLYKKKNEGLMLFDRFIAINSKIRSVMTTESQLDESQVDLIYSVISMNKREEALKHPLADLYEKFNLDPGKVYFTFIGRLSTQKSPLDLVSLIKKIQSRYNTEYNFVIVGDGELYDEVENAISEEGLLGIITQIKYIENTFELHRISSGIMFTSLYEGLPIAMLEALSVGTPVLSTDTGDIKKVVDAYHAGIIFEKIADVDSYFDGFCGFIDNFEQITDSIKKKSDDIASEFSPENIAHSYYETFSNAMLPYLTD